VMIYPQRPALIGGMAACLLAITCAARAADQAEPKPQAVAGLVTDTERKSPKEIKSLTVKQDGEETPVKYVVDADLNAKSTAALAGIFSVARVRLTYKLDGETRHLTGIEKIPGKSSGTITGQVVATHGWWVEVKPRDGSPEGFACNYPKEKWQATEAQIKALEKEDWVSIQFVTDGERHRIVKLEKKEIKDKAK
jgi:hypothetical protein